ERGEAPLLPGALVLLVHLDADALELLDDPRFLAVTGIEEAEHAALEGWPQCPAEAVPALPPPLAADLAPPEISTPPLLGGAGLVGGVDRLHGGRSHLGESGHRSARLALPGRRLGGRGGALLRRGGRRAARARAGLALERAETLDLVLRLAVPLLLHDVDRDRLVVQLLAVLRRHDAGSPADVGEVARRDLDGLRVRVVEVEVRPDLAALEGLLVDLEGER